MTPEPFSPGYRLIDGNELNDRIANPVWSTSASLAAVPGGDVTTSSKILDAITNITVATVVNAGVVLPQALQGTVMLVNNSAENDVVVFAEGGSTINGIPGDVGDVLATGTSSLYVAAANLTWISSNFNVPTGGGNASDTVGTVADFEAAAFANTIESVSILGYYAIGVGALQVRRVASEPTHPWKFRSTDRYLPDGSTDNTNGGWWEGYPADGGNIFLEAFGAVPDGSTDALPAFNDAMAYVAYYIDANPQTATYSSLVLNCGVGQFRFSSGITLTTKMFIRGVGVGIGGGGPATSFFFDYGSNGISLTTSAAAASLIEGLIITCNDAGRGGAWDSRDAYCGIYSNYRLQIINCLVFNWPLHGVWIVASYYGVGGNANDWLVSKCWFPYNGHDGFRVSGGDTNAGACEYTSATFNGGFGFLDDSFLGNSYVALHTEANGIPQYSAAYNVTQFVSFGGNVYKIYQQDPIYPSSTNIVAAQTTPPAPGSTVWMLLATNAAWGAAGYNMITWGEVLYNGVVYNVIAGQESLMWTSQPDVSPSVWTATGAPAAATIYITWKLNLAPYIYGGAYGARSTNATSCFTGCYQEGGQGSSYDIGGSSWLGCAGVTHYWDSNGLSISSRNWTGAGKGTVFFPGTVVSPYDLGSGAEQTVMLNSGLGLNNNVIQWSTTADGDTGQVYGLKRDNKTWWLNIGGSTTIARIYATGGGRPAGTFQIDSLLVGGASNGNLAINGAPNAGTHQVGDIFLNSVPGIPTFAWRCTVAGTPGTYETIYGSYVPIYGSFTVGSLPSAAGVGAGARAFVTDATNSTYAVGDAVSGTGGGSKTLPIFSNGTAWVYG